MMERGDYPFLLPTVPIFQYSILSIFHFISILDFLGNKKEFEKRDIEISLTINMKISKKPI
ncbi:MAG: hypothetical protein KG012_08470 [Deltaproteobacteria bacterium]|nr:hypothetical protein [Deltaproteobacteria bacterium]